MKNFDIAKFKQDNNSKYFELQDWALEIVSRPLSDRNNHGYILFDSLAWLTNVDIQILSLEQRGLLCAAIDYAHQNLEFDFLEAVKEKYKVIIRYTIGNTKRPHLPVDVKRDVLSAGKCGFCGSTENLTVDHIKPFSKGGSHERANLQCLCLQCNLQKSNKWSDSE